MAIVQFPGSGVAKWPEEPFFNSMPFLTAPNDATMTTAGDLYAFIFRCPITGNLEEIGVALRTVSSSQPLIWSFRDVDLTTGFPDGTDDQTSSAASTAVGWHTSGTIANAGTKRAVTMGDIVCAVAAWSGSAGNIGFNGSGPIDRMVEPVYMAKFNGGAWRKQFVGYDAWPCFAVKYDDGVWYKLRGRTYPVTDLQTRSFNSGSTPDEQGNAFEVPFTMEVIGAWVVGQFDADTDIVLYDTDGTSVLASATIDPDEQRQTTACNREVQFTSAATLDPGGTYRLVCKPTTGGGGPSISEATVGAAAVQSALGGGTTVQLTTRTNAGAWTETSTKRMWMGLLINGVDTSSGGGGGTTRSRVQRGM